MSRPRGSRHPHPRHRQVSSHWSTPHPSSPLIGCSGAAVAELETNARLERALGRLSLPRATELVLPSSGARVQLLLPPGYREADDFTFPLLVFL